MATLKDIARSIASNHSLSGKDAESFASAIVDTILDGLEKDRSVKIKGFGTFKLTAVRDRESVNVNTGERVTISGHDKITFTPENSVKDLINKPFAQFDTVILGDDMNLEEFGHVDTENSEEDNEAVADEGRNVNDVVEEISAHSDEPEVIAESTTDSMGELPMEEVPVTVEEPVTVEVPVTVEEPVRVEESVNEGEPAKVDGPSVVEESAIADGPVVEEGVTVQSSMVSEKEDKAEIDTDSYLEEDDEEDGNNRNCKKVFIVYAIVINIIVAFVAFVAGYMCSEYNVFNLRDSEKATVENTELSATPKDSVISKPDTLVKVKKDSSVVRNTTNKVEEKSEDEASKNKDVEKHDKKVEQAASNQQTNAQSKYDNDPRVRTGAYVIIGVDQTVTVRSGQTLKSISHTYLGPDMECYVEAINGKSEVKTGDKVMIPKLVLKKRLSKNK